MDFSCGDPLDRLTSQGALENSQGMISLFFTKFYQGKAMVAYTKPQERKKEENRRKKSWTTVAYLLHTECCWLPVSSFYFGAQIFHGSAIS